MFEEEGLEHIQEELRKIDPEYHEVVDLSNHRRITRALEVAYESGQPYSDFLKRPDANRYFNTIKIGLAMDRDKLYQRINDRVDAMISSGLGGGSTNDYFPINTWNPCRPLDTRNCLITSRAIRRWMML